MTNFNFDEVIDRHGTRSIKWDFPAKFKKPVEALPLWVADMDFRAPQPVLDALAASAAHGVFGYSESDDAYAHTVLDWMRRRHGWQVEPDWLLKSPGVVVALNLATIALTEPGDAVLVQPPVYPPIHQAPGLQGRRLVVSELQLRAGRYEIDFEDFERQVVGEQVKLFILCNPHNPLGRLWSRSELERLGDICVKHGVRVISDEIHQDLVLPGGKHTVFASIKPEFAEVTLTCTAPSKTFNLAGLATANLFASNATLRKAIAKELHRVGVDHVNQLGLAACEAAYREGEPWLDALLAYLQGNVDLVRGFLAERVPEVRLVEPEATYLLWLDFRALGLSDAELDKFVTNEAGLWLNDGPTFGQGGSGFQRMNVACPRSVLAGALESLAAAVAKQR